MSRNLNTWDVKSVVGRWQVGGGVAGAIRSLVNARSLEHSRSLGRPRKRWIDTVKDCLRKRS